jgi:hypothetical protein
MRKTPRISNPAPPIRKRMTAAKTATGALRVRDKPKGSNVVHKSGELMSAKMEKRQKNGRRIVARALTFPGRLPN